MSFEPTRRYNPDQGTRWQDPANIVLAIWFFVSPWVLQFGDVSTARSGAEIVAAQGGALTAAWNAWILSVIVFIVAMSAMGRLALWQEWINMLLGAWIFVAPWVLGFGYGLDPSAAWDHWIVGALIFLVSAASLSNARTPAERGAGARRESYDRMQHEPSRR